MRFQKFNNLKETPEKSIFLIIFCSILMKIFIHEKYFNFIGRLVLKNNKKLFFKWDRILNFI